MKLKTLKDLKPFLHGDTEYQEESDYDLFSREQLKQEAIKWVKAKNFLMSVADWVDFFNITEDDLK